MKDVIENTLKYWYIPLILGLIFIGLGAWVFATPVGSFLTLAILFSLGFIVTGALETFYAVSNRKDLRNWGWYLIGGIFGLIIGIHLVSRPGLSALILSFYIGFWMLFRSVMTISTSIDLKDSGEKKWGWILVLGISGIIFSLLLLWNPVLTGITVVLWTGFGFITLGLFHIILSFRIRKFKKYSKNAFDEVEGRVE